MERQEPQRLVFHLAAKYYVFVVALGATSFAVGVYFVQYPPSTFYARSLSSFEGQLIGIGLLGCGVFLLVLVMYRTILDRRPILEFDDDGLRYMKLFRQESILWSEVDDVGAIPERMRWIPLRVKGRTRRVPGGAANQYWTLEDIRRELIRRSAGNRWRQAE